MPPQRLRRRPARVQRRLAPSRDRMMALEPMQHEAMDRSVHPIGRAAVAAAARARGIVRANANVANVVNAHLRQPLRATIVSEQILAPVVAETTNQPVIGL